MNTLKKESSTYGTKRLGSIFFGWVSIFRTLVEIYRASHEWLVMPHIQDSKGTAPFRRGLPHHHHVHDHCKPAEAVKSRPWSPCPTSRPDQSNHPTSKKCPMLVMLARCPLLNVPRAPCNGGHNCPGYWPSWLWRCSRCLPLVPTFSTHSRADIGCKKRHKYSEPIQ